MRLTPESSLQPVSAFLTGVGTQRQEVSRPTTDPQSKLEKFPPRQVCWTSCPCDKILDISNLKEGRFIRNFKQRSSAPIACSEAEGQWQCVEMAAHFMADRSQREGDRKSQGQDMFFNNASPMTHFLHPDLTVLRATVSCLSKR